MRKNKFISETFYKKLLFYAVSISMLIFINSQPAFVQQNLTYYIEIDEQTWDAFCVNISIQNNKLENLLCTIPDIYPWLSLDHQSGNDVSKLEVTDRFGDKILFSQISSNTWMIDAKDHDIVNISYKINGRKDQILGERLSRKFARVDCGSVFLYIRELKNSPISLVVRVPSGWKLATGFPSTEQTFEYNVDNYEQLIRHPLYMAPFEEIYFKIKDRICYAIIDGRQTADVAKLSSIAAKVAYYQTKMFNDAPFDRYFFIFKLFSGQRPIVSKAYENISIFYLTYNSLKEGSFDIAKEISSNFFQVWNGSRFYPISMKWNEQNQIPCTCNFWFCYGLSDYYGTLSLVRAGYWSEEDFIKYNINTINRYFRSTNNEMPSLAMLSSHILKYDYKKSIAFIRMKGHLVGLLLDLKIRDLTENKRSLDDVMFFMNKWFGAERTGYSEGDILRGISAVTGTDLTSFFDLYIHGTAKLPFIEVLQNAGIFLESKLDTIPDLGEFNISADENIVTQITKFSPLETAGMKVGDKFISINNNQIYYPQQIEHILDTLAVGQEINLSVKREGLSLMLLAKVAGRPCNTVSLVSFEPQNERQQKIRKSWLSKQLP
jgi:predicted metalloprotease with PDZ domain